MHFESYDTMIDSVMFKEGRDETRNEREAENSAENSSEYYYDDSTGYRIYNPESEDEDLEDESEEEE